MPWGWVLVVELWEVSYRTRGERGWERKEGGGRERDVETGGERRQLEIVSHWAFKRLPEPCCQSLEY